jgi:5-oxoprolinase (ATP-hydrolysing) subunit A
MITIDVNCDVGEGMENEHLIMPFISSCNIACGGHFGNETTIDETIQLAKVNHVKIGVHPSFPDTENFGRKILDISPLELQQSIESQLDLFASRLKKSNSKLHHIKAHGALYNLIAKDKQAAKQFIKSIEKHASNVFLYVPYNSEIAKEAIQQNINIKYEAFGDRNYNVDLSLVSRDNENALITNPIEVFNHIFYMIQHKKVITLTKEEISIKANTFCVHGDTVNAFEIVKEVSMLLKAQNIQIA